VGYQSGSHYATIQALETCLKPDDIKLKSTRKPINRGFDGRIFDCFAGLINCADTRASERMTR
jgi:hypothetical protein